MHIIDNNYSHYSHNRILQYGRIFLNIFTIIKTWTLFWTDVQQENYSPSAASLIKPFLSYFICTKTQAYPVIRGRVSVEKRAKGGLSLSMSQMVYCPVCLGWRNTAISKPHRPWAPHSHGLRTQGPPKAELLTQKNWPETEEKQRVRCTSLIKCIRLMLLKADLHLWESWLMIKRVNFTETAVCKELR